MGICSIIHMWFHHSTDGNQCCSFENFGGKTVTDLKVSYYIQNISQTLRATSHTRLRVRDHCTSSTLIGGNGGAGRSSLHTMIEGPTEYVNARWM